VIKSSAEVLDLEVIAYHGNNLMSFSIREVKLSIHMRWDK